MQIKAMQRLPEFSGNIAQWARSMVDVCTKNFMTLLRSKQEIGMPVKLPRYTVATLPPADEDDLIIIVADDVDGPVIARSENGKWLAPGGQEVGVP